MYADIVIAQESEKFVRYHVTDGDAKNRTVIFAIEARPGNVWFSGSPGDGLNGTRLLSMFKKTLDMAYDEARRMERSA